MTSADPVLLKHGTIVCVTSCVPNLDAALTDYTDILGLNTVSQGTVTADEAADWAAPDIAGNAKAILQPQSGADCYIRLIEQPVDPAFKATRTYGWAAFEHTAQDAFGWPKRLEDSGFEIVGPPRHIEGLDHLVAMQMIGSGQEMLYLNEIRADTETTDLPKAQSPVDRVFICILAARDRLRAVRWYVDKLGLDESETHTIPYSTINRAFDLPADSQTSLTMIHQGRMPIIEIDGYPSPSIARPFKDGLLPPGNSIVSLAVRDIHAVPLEPISAISPRLEDPFRGCLSACFRGSEGELLELIQFDGVD